VPIHHANAPDAINNTASRTPRAGSVPVEASEELGGGVLDLVELVPVGVDVGIADLAMVRCEGVLAADDAPLEDCAGGVDAGEVHRCPGVGSEIGGTGEPLRGGHRPPLGVDVGTPGGLLSDGDELVTDGLEEAEDAGAELPLTPTLLDALELAGQLGALVELAITVSWIGPACVLLIVSP
jgi:hypothetical protein